MSDAPSSEATAGARLVSLAVHELRTPASVVGGYLHMLRSGLGGAVSDGQRKMIGEAEKSCERLVTLLSELSDIGKLDAGVLVLADHPFDLFQLVHDVAIDIHEGEDRGVRLELRGEGGGAPMSGDRVRLGSALSVCVRAVLREQVGATTVVARRRLERRADEMRAVILVATEDAVEDTYAAAPSPFDEWRGGLGLGLPLARRVIERHGGRIWTPAFADGTIAERVGVVIELPLAHRA